MLIYMIMNKEPWQGTWQPRPAILVFVHVKYLEVVEEYQNGVSDRGQIEDLMRSKICKKNI